MEKENQGDFRRLYLSLYLEIPKPKLSKNDMILSLHNVDYLWKPSNEKVERRQNFVSQSVAHEPVLQASGGSW